MTKAEFIVAIAEKADMSKVQANLAYCAVFNTLADILSNQDKITIPGFGSFSVKERPARKGRSPLTGKEINIPKRIVAQFKAATPLKEMLNDRET